MLVKFLFVMILIACALYDLVEFRIPNVLSATLLILFGVWAAFARLPFEVIGDHLFAGTIVLVGTAILFRFGLLGGGDVKLLSVTCLWAGPSTFLAHLLLTSLLGLGVMLAIVAARWLYSAVLATVPRLGAVSVPRVLQRGAGIPYGVAIAASAILLSLPRGL